MTAAEIQEVVHMSTKPTFNEMVAWAQGHVHESIRKGEFDQAIFDVCERVARWRYEQDAESSTQHAGLPAGIISLDRIVARLRSAGAYAYVEYTGGGVATIYASPDEDPARPGSGYPNSAYHFVCREHGRHEDPGAMAIAGPGWFVGPRFNARRDEAEDSLPDGAYAYLSDFYVGPDDQGCLPPYAATEEDDEQTLAGHILDTMHGNQLFAEHWDGPVSVKPYWTLQ